MPKFTLVHKKIKEARNQRVITAQEKRDISFVKYSQRQDQRAMRPVARVRDNKVDRMRGDKYGWTFTRQHGGREFRVLGEACLICGYDHGARCKPWWEGLI